MKVGEPEDTIQPACLHKTLADTRSKYRLYSVPGGMIYLDVHESKMMRARAFGRYEQNKMNLIMVWLKPGGTFVGVGSNKGDFTPLAAKVVGRDGKVLSFEPEPDNCYWIRKSVEANGYRNIELFEVALSTADGTASLYLGSKSGWHTLLPGHPNRSNGAVTVMTRKLDSVLREANQTRVDMIKIDVEGAELEVLKGARQALSDNLNIVLLMDLHPYLGVELDEVFKILEELDLKVYKLQTPFNIPATANRELSEILAYRGSREGVGIEVENSVSTWAL